MALFDDPELLAMVLPALRADYAALAAYSWTPRGPLHTPVTVLCGDADPVVSVEEAAGWRAFTSAWDRRAGPSRRSLLCGPAAR